MADLTFTNVIGGELVAARLGELDDGLRAQAPVEVVVQQHLGRAQDLVVRGAVGHGAHPTSPGPAPGAQPTAAVKRVQP